MKPLLKNVVAMLCVAASASGVSSVSAQSATGTKAPAKAAKAPAAAAINKDSVAQVARLAAELRGYETRLVSLRKELLSRASWADLGTRCNPGALRIFASDTLSAQQQSTEKLITRMEDVVVLNGAGASLAGADMKALLRVIVGWEAGIDRPRWDEDGKGVHYAFAAGLTGEVPNPEGPGCLPSPIKSDTVTFVVPGFATMEFPKAKTPRVKAYFGPLAQKRARDEFFASVGSKRPDAELSYITIAPIAHWRGWAVVGVDRPKERGGIEVGSGTNGGAVYLMRRVEGQWRLLAIVRSRG